MRCGVRVAQRTTPFAARYDIGVLQRGTFKNSTIGRVHKFRMERVRKFWIWARSELGIGHDVPQAFRTGGILTWGCNGAVKTNRLVYDISSCICHSRQMTLQTSGQSNLTRPQLPHDTPLGNECTHPLPSQCRPRTSAFAATRRDKLAGMTFSLKIDPLLGGSEPPSNTWCLGPTESRYY